MSAETMITVGQGLSKGFLGLLFGPVIKEVGELHDFGDVQYAAVILSSGHAALVRAVRVREGTVPLWTVERVTSQKRWVEESIASSSKMPQIETAERTKVVLRTFHPEGNDPFECFVTLGEALGGTDPDQTREV